MNTVNQNGFLHQIKCFIASGFGSGLLKPAAGTWGTLAALLLAVLLRDTPFLAPYFPLTGFCFLFCLLNFWSAKAAISQWGEDPPQMVMDEFSGLFLALALFFEIVPTPQLEIVNWWNDIHSYLMFFAVFRFFDIIKPLGINRLQQYSGGFGILLDDLAAGGLTFLTIYTIYLLI